MRVRSEGRGHGSEFAVELPRFRAGRAPAQPDETGAAGRGITPRRRILVVDDNRDAAETLAEALRLEGHDVEVAADGERALA